MSAPKTSGAAPAHTPGPWKVWYDRIGVAPQINSADQPFGGNPCVVHWSGFDHCDLPNKRRIANAARIVACVNALEGVTTDALAAFPMGHMTELALAAGECAKERASLAALVADLRDALRGILPLTLIKFREDEIAVNTASAALSRCEGTTTAEPVSLSSRHAEQSTAQPASLSVLDQRCDQGGAK